MLAKYNRRVTAIPTDRAFAPPRPGLVASAFAVFEKDLRIELRTREIVTTAGLFAVLIATLASLSFHTGADQGSRTAPGAMWLSIAFSSVLALARTWQREREDGALVALLISPIPRASIFIGKALGVFVFITAIECIVVPVVALLFHIDLVGEHGVIGSLVPLLVLGTLGVSATGTLFGAMTVRTRARDLVLASVLFPLLSPTLLSGVVGTRELLGGASFTELRDYFILLSAFDAVAILGGIGLFGPLMGD